HEIRNVGHSFLTWLLEPDRSGPDYAGYTRSDGLALLAWLAVVRGARLDCRHACSCGLRYRLRRRDLDATSLVFPGISKRKDGRQSAGPSLPPQWNLVPPYSLSGIGRRGQSCNTSSIAYR